MEMTTSLISPTKGEIWTVRFDPAIGAEIQKIRPAAVINVPEVGRLPLRIIVPLTDWRDSYSALPWFISIPASPLNNLAKDSGADAFQIKSISTKRFIACIGRVTDEELEKIISALLLCVGFKSPK